MESQLNQRMLELHLNGQFLLSKRTWNLFLILQITTVTIYLNSRILINHSAYPSEPLYKFVTKSKFGKITQPDELLELVESIKTLIVNAPVLTYPSEDHMFILDIDASDTAKGSELLQLIVGVEHVIFHGSYILTSEQQK